MSEEPDFIHQTAEPKTQDERRQWHQQQIMAGQAKGVTFYRSSFHPTLTNILLYEGWKAAPKDQGEPRFQLQH